MRIPGLLGTLFSVFAFLSSLRADPASAAHPRVSIESDHLTLTFDQAPGPDLYIVELSDELAQWHSGNAFMETVSTVPGPGGTQTVKVRSRSLVSVKPKEFMRLRVIVDPHYPVVYLSGTTRGIPPAPSSPRACSASRRRISPHSRSTAMRCRCRRAISC